MYPTPLLRSGGLGTLYKGRGCLAGNRSLFKRTARLITQPLQSFSVSTMPVQNDYLDVEGQPDYLRMILTSRVYDVCKETPCDPAVRLSKKLGVRVDLKREDLQPVFSFKIRGAYNMMAHLSAEDRWKGVISCSAGNHAQGVAYSAAKLDIPATIVMPLGTPAIKYQNVQRLGAKVILFGQDFDSALAECNRLQEAHGLTFIPPFDHPYVIAGQGTIGLEVLRQIDYTKLKAIFLCVGGGGLIAGVGSYIKRVAPHVKIIGVETQDADAMTRSLAAGKRVTLKEVGLFADGAAVKVPGEVTFDLAKQYIDEMVLVSTDEICAAINDVFDDTRSIIEPAGALSVAGLKKYVQERRAAGEEINETDDYCAVLSGANMNFDRLRFVSERSRLGAGKEVFFIVEMPERPGAFRELVKLLAPRDVSEFSYRYSEANKARVYISFSVKDRDVEIPELLEKIKAADMNAYDVSDNDLAKSHARYMVGGTPGLTNEKLLRFEFPERPGALNRFLECIQSQWNVSLFHYRNNGSDIGRVLAGIQVPADQNAEFEKFLSSLGYPYTEENDNIAYKLFLK